MGSVGKNKRIITVFFILIFVFVFLVTGCGDTPGGGEDKSDESSGEGLSLVPHLEKKDYAGKTLAILCTLEKDEFGDSQIAPLETTGEPVNDAFYERNNLLEAEYGYKIEAIYTESFTNFTNKVRDDLFADTAEYDIVTSGLYDLAPLVIDGILMDLSSIDNSHLQLDRDWWDIKSNADMSIANRQFFITGDIFVLDDESTVVTYFNRDIIDKNNLEDPYELVENGMWTIDKMYEMGKTAVMDDGDGIMDVTGGDTWGLVCDSFQGYHYTLGCNTPQVEKDKDDLPVLTITNSRNVDAFGKVHEMMTDRACTAYTEQYYAWNDPEGRIVRDHFYSGRALFFGSYMAVANGENMREAPISFGVLPMPKFNEEQEHYTSTINPYRFYCLSVTKAKEHDKEALDFITFALEGMAYLSRKSITPEYYERTLKLKRFDDSGSIEMLDIIFQNRIVDLSTVFNWADCIQWYNGVLRSSTNTIISFVEGKQDAFNSEMANTIDQIIANN